MRRNNKHTGIYVHFPYCIHKCDYCDFYSVGLDRLSSSQTDGKTVPAEFYKNYREAITSEFQGRVKDFRAYEKVNTVYFGGGTASLLPAEDIAYFLELFEGELDFSSDVEITLEGNPENFTPEYFRSLKDTGVNRANVGLQTFDGEALERMNRYYDPDRYASILTDMSESPIKNIGVDLIYGFPGISGDSFFADLERALSAPLNHLSLYSLTAEPGTVYTRSVEQGVIKAPEEEIQYEIFKALPALLADKGFNIYEISNYARPGAECRHNLRYWLHESYIGLGPGAHGFTGYKRYANMRNTRGWIQAPLAALQEDQEVLMDLPLNILRIALPFALKNIEEVFLESIPEEPEQARRHYQRAHELLSDWADRGLARITTDSEGDEHFQWLVAGYLRLDDHVLEITKALDSVHPG